MIPPIRPRFAFPALAVLLPCFLTTPLSAAGSGPPLDWSVTFQGDGTPFATDVLGDLAVNDAGEICVTGLSAVESGATAAATVFYEPDGSERWRHLYAAQDTAGLEEGLAVFLDDSGRCRVTGRRSSFDTGPDILVLEYDPQGDLRWSASYDGPGGDFDAGVDVVADGDGNVYVVGLITGDGTGWDMVTLKYDAAGTELWARIVDGPVSGEERPVGVAVDGDGSVYAAGTAGVSNPFGDDLVVVKYAADGDELWREYIDGGVDGADQAGALALDTAGNPHVAGRLLTPPGSEWHAGVVKLLPDGSRDWTGTFGHPSAGIPEDVLDLVVGADGVVTVLATGSNDVLTGRFDSGGNLSWDHLQDSVSIADLAVRPLAVDGNGNAYIAAHDFVPGNGQDFFIYRLQAADGAFAWSLTFGEEGEDADDFPVAVVIDPEGHLLVGGTIMPGAVTFENDWIVLKSETDVIYIDGFESGGL